MENSQKPNANVTPRQMKYMLKHKLASLLTQQQLEEKAQQELVQQNSSSIGDEKKVAAQNSTID